MKKSSGNKEPLDFQQKYSHLKKEVLIGVIVVLIIIIVGGAVMLSNSEINPDPVESDGESNQNKVQIDGELNQKKNFICDSPNLKMGTVCCLDMNKDKVCDTLEAEKVNSPASGSASASGLPGVTKGNIIEGSVVCDSPYIRYAQGCCLDVNNNQICDVDETGELSDSQISVSGDISGCTNPNATNYNSAAIVNDGSCVLPSALTVPTTSSTPTTSATTPSPTISNPIPASTSPAPFSPTPSTPTQPAATPPTPPSAENTRVLCSDELDNDGDGAVDELDSNCEGESCDMGSKSGKIIWSHSPGEDQSVAPPANSNGVRRIGCCAATDCRTRDGVGECINYDQPYTSTYGWICGDNNNWDRCGTTAGSNKGDGAVSDGGGHVCETNPVGWSEYVAPCTDSDDGLNVMVRGTTTGPGSPTISLMVTRVDSCTASGKVLEQFCAQGLSGHSYVNDQEIFCPSGTSCVSGACVSTAKN